METLEPLWIRHWLVISARLCWIRTIEEPPQCGPYTDLLRESSQKTQS